MKTTNTEMYGGNVLFTSMVGQVTISSQQETCVEILQLKMGTFEERESTWPQLAPLL